MPEDNSIYELSEDELENVVGGKFGSCANIYSCPKSYSHYNKAVSTSDGLCPECNAVLKYGPSIIE